MMPPSFEEIEVPLQDIRYKDIAVGRARTAAVRVPREARHLQETGFRALAGFFNAAGTVDDEVEIPSRIERQAKWAVRATET